MTREEAIRHLGTYSSTMGSGLTTQEQHEEAKKMAIEALERGPYFTISFNEDKLRELCQRAAEKLKEQFANEGVWQIMGVTLPEVGKDVLICDIDGSIYLTHRVNISKTKFAFYDAWGDKIKNIVAWMPLPKPYQEEAADDGEQNQQERLEL